MSGLLHHFFEVVELVVTLLAHASGVGQLVRVFTVFGLFLPAMDVVAMIAHPLGIVFGVLVRTASDLPLLVSLVLSWVLGQMGAVAALVFLSWHLGI